MHCTCPLSGVKRTRARAFEEESPILRAEWETLAESYVRLAEQTDETEQLDPDDPILGLLGASRH